jgi:curved DNA-binding protein CbpA
MPSVRRGSEQYREYVEMPEYTHEELPSGMLEPAIARWMSVLDDLTYYELFGVDPSADVDEVRAAYHAFCSTFHPDLHFTRSIDDHRAVSMIFKRGNEAYFVLSDTRRREQYDAQLAERPDERPRRVSFSSLVQSRSRSSSASPRSLEDATRSASARPFARRAEELAAEGDLRQAKLQLAVAMFKDPGNDVLDSAMRDLERRIAQAK